MSSSFGFSPDYSGSAPAAGAPGVTTASTVSGTATYTEAQVLGGLVLHDCGGGAATGTTGTAAAIVAALSGAAIGSSFDVHVRNTSDAAETLTVAGGTGVTVSGTATVAQNNAKTFRFVVTDAQAGSEAVTAYSLGSVVF